MKTPRSVLFALVFACVGMAFAIAMLTTWFYTANIGNKDPDEYILSIAIMSGIEFVLIVITSVYGYKYQKNKKLEKEAQPIQQSS